MIFVACAFALSTVNNPIHLARNNAEYGKWRSSANKDVYQYMQCGHRHYNQPPVKGCASLIAPTEKVLPSCSLSSDWIFRTLR